MKKDLKKVLALLVALAYNIFIARGIGLLALLGMILMSKYQFHRFNVEGTVMTAGDIALVYDISIDDLLAMQPDDVQTFGDVSIIKL